MANPAKGEIEITLDRPRLWRLRWKDIAEIENALKQLTGQRISWQAFRSKMQDWSITDFAVVLWAGLRHEDPQLSLEQVMEIADYTKLDEFLAAFAERMAEAIPESFKKKLEAAARATQGNGQSSSSLATPASISA